MHTKKTIVEPPNLSIITIAFKINSELFRCLNSCKFSKISIEHILVFPRKEYKKARLKFRNTYKILFDNGDGVYNALNLGISKATGSKLLILHGDNLLSDNGAKLIEDNFLNQTIQFGCSTIFNDNTNSFLFVKLNFFYLICGLYPPHPGLIIERKYIKYLGLYNENYKICSDFDYFIRIYKSKLKIKYINKEIIISPSGGISSSGIRSVLSIIIERIKILKNYYWFLIGILPITILVGYSIKIIHRKFLN